MMISRAAFSSNLRIHATTISWRNYKLNFGMAAMTRSLLELGIWERPEWVQPV
jgi:hypothetical protein